MSVCVAKERKKKREKGETRDQKTEYCAIIIASFEAKFFFCPKNPQGRFFSFLFGFFFFFFFFLLKNHPIRKNTTHIKTDKNTKHHRRESEEEISRLVDTSSLCFVTSSFLVVRYDEKDDARRL